jgi:hypothetical protein
MTERNRNYTKQFLKAVKYIVYILLFITVIGGLILIGWFLRGYYEHNRLTSYKFRFKKDYNREIDI